MSANLLLRSGCVAAGWLSFPAHKRQEIRPLSGFNIATTALITDLSAYSITAYIAGTDINPINSRRMTFVAVTGKTSHHGCLGISQPTCAASCKRMTATLLCAVVYKSHH